MSPITNELMIVAAVVVCTPAGLIVGYFLRKRTAEKKIKSAEEQAHTIVFEATKAAETTKKEKVIEAKEEIHKMRSELDKEKRDLRAENQRTERRLLQKEESLDKKSENLEKKEENLSKRKKELSERQSKIDELAQKQMEELERISGLTIDDAKETIARRRRERSTS